MVVGLLLLGPLLQKLNHSFGQTLRSGLLTTAKWDSHLVLSLCATFADVVSGYGELDNPALFLLVAYQATTEDLLQIDPSGRPLEYTKGSAGARVLRVDLVVLWDVVRLG